MKNCLAGKMSSMGFKWMIQVWIHSTSPPSSHLPALCNSSSFVCRWYLRVSRVTASQSVLPSVRIFSLWPWILAAAAGVALAGRWWSWESQWVTLHWPENIAISHQDWGQDNINIVYHFICCTSHLSARLLSLYISIVNVVISGPVRTSEPSDRPFSEPLGDFNYSKLSSLVMDYS